MSGLDTALGRVGLFWCAATDRVRPETMLDQPLADLGRQIGPGIEQPIPHATVKSALSFCACKGWAAARHRAPETWIEPVFQHAR